MSLKKLLSVLMLLIGIISYSQNLTCKDFKEGAFYTPIVRLNDSLVINIIRKGNTQIETKQSVELDEKSYTLIERIDECDYRIKYDESKMKLDEDQQFINNNGGLLVEKIK